MEQRLQMVEFGVTGPSEVLTLLSRWQQVLAAAPAKATPHMVMRTYRQEGLVGIKVEHRRPGEEVLLTFLAPKEVLARFLADLRAQGLEVVEEQLIPGLATTCRLRARSLQ